MRKKILKEHLRKYQHFAGTIDMIIYRPKHKTERMRQGGKAALLLATFSSNDFVVSGRTEGFHAETSTAVRIGFNSLINSEI
jgi:hypothetical protein